MNNAIANAFSELTNPKEQREIAKVYLSAFLETTLKGNEVYKELFTDYRAAGDWLPQTAYITQFSDYGFVELAGFEEDIDPQTLSLPGAYADGINLSRWREKAPRFRNGDRQDDYAVLLGWKGDGGRYSIDLPAEFEWQLDEDVELVFEAADARAV